MPRRLNVNVVRQMFLDAGYELPANFHYTNSKVHINVYDKFTNTNVRITVQQLKYKIAHEQRPQWHELPLLGIAGDVQEPLTAFDRFVRNHETVLEYDANTQHVIYDLYMFFMRNINRKQTFTYQFGNVENATHPRATPETNAALNAIVNALCDSIHKVNRTHDIRLELTTTDNRKRFMFVNITTLNTLYDMFEHPEPNFEVQDSANDMLWNDYDYQSLTFHFLPTNPNSTRRVRAGFFPFINTTTTDLSRYGIYNSIDDERLIEPCILTAFKASNVFTENEINQLSDMIKVNNFPQSELKCVSKLFNVDIYVRHYKGEKDTSHIDIRQEHSTRSLKLMILYDHYIIYECRNKSSNYSLIKKMINNQQLRPMTDKEIESITKRILTRKQTKPIYNNRRLIHVPDEKMKPFIKYNQYLFGYEPDSDEIEYRLNQLQDFIDSLKLRHHINVRCYKRFSTLMNKIMYEFGCFDNVYELTGSECDKIRESLTFPKREMKDAVHPGTKSSTHEINEKCYYIDFNGAFCSFMTEIPSGVDGRTNPKINELIHIMYDARLHADKKFAKTLKVLMCSCYGSSIRRPKLHKNKFTNNKAHSATDEVLDKLIKEYGDLVISHNDKGFATIKNSYVEHYTHPQFAKVILDGFNAKCNEIKSHVNVLFQNFDAFVVNESDFNKLNELGYIHPFELGKLKVEHVFTSMTFKNKNQWLGVNEDGTIFNHGLVGT